MSILQPHERDSRSDNRAHHDAEQCYAEQTPRPVGQRASGCNQPGLQEVEQRPGKKQEAVHVDDGRGMEGTACKTRPVGRRESTKGYQYEYFCCSLLKPTGFGTNGNAVSKDSFHQQTPRILFSGSILRQNETFGQGDVVPATSTHQIHLNPFAITNNSPAPCATYKPNAQIFAEESSLCRVSILSPRFKSTRSILVSRRVKN